MVPRTAGGFFGFACIAALQRAHFGIGLLFLIFFFPVAYFLIFSLLRTDRSIAPVAPPPRVRGPPSLRIQTRRLQLANSSRLISACLEPPRAKQGVCSSGLDRVLAARTILARPLRVGTWTGKKCPVPPRLCPSSRRRQFPQSTRRPWLLLRRLPIDSIRRPIHLRHGKVPTIMQPGSRREHRRLHRLGAPLAVPPPTTTPPSSLPILR